LSYNKPVTTSSNLDGYPKENAVDENVRTSWVASSNTEGEWITIDLLVSSLIHAIQVNFSEEGSTHQGYREDIYQSYTISASNDGKKWYLIVDKSNKRTDTPHDYIEFEEPFKARYIRLENKRYTVAPYFSLRDLRVFGKGSGCKPVAIENFIVQRNPNDPCKATLKWNATEGAEGYIIRYGTKKDKLYNNFQIWEKTMLNINSLNSGVPYYFTIDTYNSNGVTPGEKIIKSL
ncbi:MAG: discoidin domain-containing protein, partial [Proteiniphilum sp.]